MYNFQNYIISFLKKINPSKLMKNEILQELEKFGIVKVRNFLNFDEVDQIKNILKYYSAPKGHHKSYYSTKLIHFILKLIKLDFRKFKDDFLIYQLAKKKDLNQISNKIFKRKSFLKFIDGYYSPVSNKDVLPWHTDQAYQGDERKQSGYVNPDHAHLKFFIYLSKVGPNNGCMSYIPESHKLGYAIRKGIFENEIEYEPYFTLKEFRNFLCIKKNRIFVENFLNDYSLVENFLNKTNFIEKNEESEEFDYSLLPGDAIIFNEGGVHKGSKSLINERFVLRYLYSIKKN